MYYFPPPDFQGFLDNYLKKQRKCGLNQDVRKSDNYTCFSKGQMDSQFISFFLL